jgi:hypothetical protein
VTWLTAGLQFSELTPASSRDDLYSLRGERGARLLEEADHAAELQLLGAADGEALLEVREGGDHARLGERVLALDERHKLVQLRLGLGLGLRLGLGLGLREGLGLGLVLGLGLGIGLRLGLGLGSE